MELMGTLMELRGTLMELRRMERMARKYGAQVGDQFDTATKALRPYAKQARKQVRGMSRELRPLGKQAVTLIRKHPAGTFAFALVAGYLVASFRR